MLRLLPALFDPWFALSHLAGSFLFSWPTMIPKVSSLENARLVALEPAGPACPSRDQIEEAWRLLDDHAQDRKVDLNDFEIAGLLWNVIRVIMMHRDPSSVSEIPMWANMPAFEALEVVKQVALVREGRISEINYELGDGGRQGFIDVIEVFLRV